MKEIVDINKQFKEWETISNNTIQSAIDKAEAIVAPIQKEFSLGVLEDIGTNFGKFLDEALGDRVTGQRSSVLNPLWLNSETGKSYQEKAKEKGISVEDYLKHHDYFSHWNNTKRYCKTQAYLSSGRAFGVSYWTGNNLITDESRMHTCNVSPDGYWKYILQGHVDCIKNKEKRQLVQDFVNFRDEMQKELMGENIAKQVIELDVDLDVAQFSTLVRNNRYSFDLYNRNSKYNLVLESIEKHPVTHVALFSPDISVWDGISQVSIGSRGDPYIPYISINAGRKLEKTNAEIYGNVDIGVKSYLISLVKAIVPEDNSLVSHLSEVSRGMGSSNCSFTSLVNNEGHYSYSREKTVNGLLLGWDILLQNPLVANEIQRRVEFFKRWSKRLQDIKMNHAALYFINS